mmetsp:Transcript_41127/g.132299  ORF Transcript_41127/g.132299 Transcript_41127/m.132299 type:complete len:223 (-) Transcript_41127:461-1129(-)
MVAAAPLPRHRRHRSRRRQHRRRRSRGRHCQSPQWPRQHQRRLGGRLRRSRQRPRVFRRRHPRCRSPQLQRRGPQHPVGASVPSRPLGRRRRRLSLLLLMLLWFSASQPWLRHRRLQRRRQHPRLGVRRHLLHLLPPLQRLGRHQQRHRRHRLGRRHRRRHGSLQPPHRRPQLRLRRPRKLPGEPEKARWWWSAPAATPATSRTFSWTTSSSPLPGPRAGGA